MQQNASVWLYPLCPSSLTCRCLHPLKSRYVALPCDHCFDTWTIWTISIIILDSLFFSFFFFLTLMQTSVSFVSEQGNSDVCTSRVHERLFLMSYPRKVSLLSHSRFPDWSIEMEFPNFCLHIKVNHANQPAVPAATIEHVLETWTVFVFNAHPLYACLYCSLYWN